LAPVFFIIYLLPKVFPSVFSLLPPSGEGNSLFIGAFWTVPLLWILFLASEITDLLDGMMARKRGEVSDFGKLYDPFADSLTQITFFLCFVIDGILPPLFFLIILYREFGILLVRNLMLKKGIALGARKFGKIKTVACIVAVGFALLASSIMRLGFSTELFRIFALTAEVVFIFSVIISVLSFIDYILVYLKTPHKTA
jgi:CDP-diacylglycerol--glycerol-3-phosphate 3-phosphatidyltransferase